jgi:hypothetical protein
MPQATITYDTAYNRKLKSLLDEMDAKHWNNGTAQYHPSMLGFKLSNFHGDYAGEPSAKMMVGGGSHGDQRFVSSGNSPAYPPYMMSSGLLVNSGGSRIGVDGAVGGYSFNDFIGDVASVGKEVAPDLIRAYAKGSGRRRKKGGSAIGDQIAGIAKTLAPFAPLLLGLGRPAPRRKQDVVDALASLGAKKSHSLKKLKEIAMSGGYSFDDFLGDVASVGKAVAPDLIRSFALGAGTKKGQRRKTARKAYEGGINLKDVIDSAVPTIKNLVQSADPEVKEQAVNLAKSIGNKIASKGLSQLKSAFGAGRGRSARTAIVKKVMAEKGLSMIEASKYVKAHKLY